MMFLDASAMIGIIAMEDDGSSLAGRLARSPQVHTSAVAIFEAAVGLARIANAPVAMHATARNAHRYFLAANLWMELTKNFPVQIDSTSN